MQSYQS